MLAMANHPSKKQVNHHNKNMQVNSLRNKEVVKESNNNSYSRYLLVPIFLILCILPLIMRYVEYKNHMSGYSWFSTGEISTDFFLYGKQRFLILIGAVMAIIILIKVYSDKKSLKISPIYIPLAIYGIMVIVSTIFSVNFFASISGSLDLFESVFVLLAYCLLAFYPYLILKEERDFKMIFYFLLAISLFFSVYGIFQYLGYDFLSTELGYNLLVPYEHRDGVGLTFNFGAKRVYLTLFNPNYVGVYVALVVPILMALLLLQKKVFNMIITILSIVGLLICTIGAQSLASFIGLAVALLFLLACMWRYIIKRWYIAICILVLLIAGAFVTDNMTDHFFINKLKNSMVLTKSENPISDIHTEADHVSLTMNGNELRISYAAMGNDMYTLIASDGNGLSIPFNYDPATESNVILDERFSGISYGMDKENLGVFYIAYEGIILRFTNQTTNGSYAYINRFNRADYMITAPSAVFTGYESIASGRGYVWSRTIPLLKKHIIIGSGPDTFAIAFPQQDYYNLIRYGYGDQLLTKPHNMYLQMAIQTGDISLIAFIVFYLMYFASSISLYIRGRFNSFYAKMGVAVFVGTISYMVTGLTNDSNINTAPTFWVLLGTGIALNIKVKPLIMEEIRLSKQQKEENKQPANEIQVE